MRRATPRQFKQTGERSLVEGRAGSVELFHRSITGSGSPAVFILMSGEPIRRRVLRPGESERILRVMRGLPARG